MNVRHMGVSRQCGLRAFVFMLMGIVYQQRYARLVPDD